MLLSRFCLLFLLLACAGRLAAADSVPSLAGHWKIDLARSTELSPWKDYVLAIAIAGDAITLERHLAWGSRAFTDTMTVRIGRTETVPVEMWPDNRHLGAYIGDDHRKRVRAEWADNRRRLQLATDLVLETQQGASPVTISSDYALSPDGAQLTLTERRSTRSRPVVYLFNRVESKK